MVLPRRAYVSNFSLNMCNAKGHDQKEEISGSFSTPKSPNQIGGKIAIAKKNKNPAKCWIILFLKLRFVCLELFLPNLQIDPPWNEQSKSAKRIWDNFPGLCSGVKLAACLLQGGRISLSLDLPHEFLVVRICLSKKMFQPTCTPVRPTSRIIYIYIQGKQLQKWKFAQLP